jgi:autonomous glycyl radical cofactor GrcA
MAKVFGEPGKHAGRQSVEAFKRMFATLFVLGLVVAFCEGVILTALVTNHVSGRWFLLPVIVGIFLWWLADYANRRVDKHETDRMSWRKGAVGEYEVGAELERLCDSYYLFNDVNTGRGNIDHIVVGPTGLFAIETKDWKGVIIADGRGELKVPGRFGAVSSVRKFLSRAMLLREQVVALKRSNDFFFRAVMVFTKARVEARFGETGKVHCIRLEQLRDYIDNPKFSQNLSRDRVSELVGALHSVTGADEAFES